MQVGHFFWSQGSGRADPWPMKRYGSSTWGGSAETFEQSSSLRGNAIDAYQHRIQLHRDAGATLSGQAIELGQLRSKNPVRAVRSYNGAIGRWARGLGSWGPELGRVHDAVPVSVPRAGSERRLLESNSSLNGQMMMSDGAGKRTGSVAKQFWLAF